MLGKKFLILNDRKYYFLKKTNIHLENYPNAMQVRTSKTNFCFSNEKKTVRQAEYDCTIFLY